jgi:hypothetical protein
LRKARLSVIDLSKLGQFYCPNFSLAAKISPKGLTISAENAIVLTIDRRRQRHAFRAIV